MPKRILFLLAVFSILTFLSAPYSFGANQNNNSSSNVWYGVYTIDDLPATLAKSLNCKIVSIGEVLASSESFIIYDPYKPLRNCKDCYLNYIDEAIENRTNNIVKAAQNLGYNAILGLKIIIASHFDSFRGSIINGSRGVGYGYVRVMGTPVTIQCQPKKH